MSLFSRLFGRQEPVQPAKATSAERDAAPQASPEPINRWVQSRLAAGTSCMVLCRDLDKVLAATPSRQVIRRKHAHDYGDNMPIIEALSNASAALANVMVERNLNGRDLEKAGNETHAIALYEANVADWFDGSHPYDRLRRIYRTRQQHADLIRVCRAYIEHGQPDPQLKDKFARSIAEAESALAQPSEPSS